MHFLQVILYGIRKHVMPYNCKLRFCSTCDKKNKTFLTDLHIYTYYLQTAFKYLQPTFADGNNLSLV